MCPDDVCFSDSSSCRVDSYEKVKENEIVEALQERVQTIVGMELMYPNGFPLGLLGPNKNAGYLHILTKKGGDHERKQWQGITGRVKQLLKEELKDHGQHFERIEQKIQRVETKIDGKFATIDQKIEQILSMLSQ